MPVICIVGVICKWKWKEKEKKSRAEGHMKRQWRSITILAILDLHILDRITVDQFYNSVRNSLKVRKSLLGSMTSTVENKVII